MNNSVSSCRKVVVLDIDGTLIPNLIDWEQLRRKVSEILNIDPKFLRPLGESLNRLAIDERQKMIAWRVIEDEELSSIKRIQDIDLSRNIEALNLLKQHDFCIVLVSMRSMKSVKKLLEILGIENLVYKVITRDYICSRIEQLKYIHGEFKNSCIVFIGDTSLDKQAGKAIGIPTIIVDNWQNLYEAALRAIECCSNVGL